MGADNLAPAGIRSLDRPARNESLYRLSYPDYGELIHDRSKRAGSSIKRQINVFVCLFGAIDPSGPWPPHSRGF